MEGGGELSSQLAMHDIKELLQEFQNYIIGHLGKQIEECRLDLKGIFSAMDEKIESKGEFQIINEQSLIVEKQQLARCEDNSESERKKKKIHFSQGMTKKVKQGGGRKGRIYLKTVLKRKNIRERWAKLRASIYSQRSHAISLQNLNTDYIGIKSTNHIEIALKKFYRWHFKTGKYFVWWWHV